MPAHDNHTQPRRIPSVPATRRTASVSPRPDPRPRRERVRPSTPTCAARPLGAPTTVWVPPTHATGQAWTDWVHAAVRAAFLSPGGCWWDMTAALAGLSPVDPPQAAPTPFWAGLIDPASRPTSTPGAAGPADLPTAGAAAATSGRSLNVTGAASPASVDVAFADLTATGETVDGRIGMLAAVALRGGGILAVLTRSHHQPAPRGALVDPTGAIVAAAQNADLLYLQHIVIPTGVIPTGPLLLPRPHPTVSPPQPPDHGDPDPHASHDSHDITHIDLLIFAQPHKYGLHTGTPIPASTNGADGLHSADDVRDDQPSAVPVRAGGDAR